VSSEEVWLYAVYECKKARYRIQDTGKQETGKLQPITLPKRFSAEIMKVGNRTQETGRQDSAGRIQTAMYTLLKRFSAENMKAGNRTVTPPEFSGLSVRLCCNTTALFYRKQEHRKAEDRFL